MKKLPLPLVTTLRDFLTRGVFRRTDCHLLGAYSESLDFEHPRTTCDIHPDADPDTRALSFAWRELIYHVMHGHNGCFEAIGLYQFFFSLCPPDQTVSIQIADEVIMFPHLPFYSSDAC
jgi:hypothetical protein